MLFIFVLQSNNKMSIIHNKFINNKGGERLKVPSLYILYVLDCSDRLFNSFFYAIQQDNRNTTEEQ